MLSAIIRLACKTRFMGFQLTGHGLHRTGLSRILQIKISLITLFWKEIYASYEMIRKCPCLSMEKLNCTFGSQDSLDITRKWNSVNNYDKAPIQLVTLLTHWLTHLVTYPYKPTHWHRFTDWFTDSPTLSPTHTNHSLTHWFTDWLTDPSCHLPTQTHSLSDSHTLIHWLAGWRTDWFAHSLSLTHSPTHSLTHSLTHTFTHPLTHPLTHPFTHSITRSLFCKQII